MIPDDNLHSQIKSDEEELPRNFWLRSFLAQASKKLEGEGAEAILPDAVSIGRLSFRKRKKLKTESYTKDI